MENQMDEFDEMVYTRIGDPLDAELAKNADYIEVKKQLKTAIDKFNDMLKLTKEQWTALAKMEDSFSERDAVCVEAAYRLGYSDGVLVKTEQSFDGKKSLLSVEDMANLIAAYDSVQKLKKTLFGDVSEDTEDTIFKVLDGIFGVLTSAACTKFSFLEEGEACDEISSIADNEALTPEERAKQLLGLQ